MELKEIEAQAKALMTMHGVGYVRFEFDRGKQRIGGTHYMWAPSQDGRRIKIPAKITLSKHYAVILTTDEIREVILHEIAHALTPNDQAHGAVWRAAARKIGSKGTRCVTPSARPEKDVEGKCPECGHLTYEAHRLPLRLYVHSGCGQPLTYYRRGSRISLNGMPNKYQWAYNRAKELGRF